MFLIWYANRMEQGEMIRILGREFAPRDTAVFIASIGCAGLLMVISAVLVFLGRRAVILGSNNFAAWCSQRVVAMNRPRPAVAGMPAELLNRQITARATGMVRTARGIRPLLIMSGPLVNFIYAMVVILVIDATLSVVVLMLIAPSMILQYRLSVRTAANQRAYGAAKRQSQRFAKSLLQRLSAAVAIWPSQQRVIAAEFEEPGNRIALDRYAFRVLSVSRSALISDVFIAVSAVVVTMSLGYKALGGQVSWTSFVGFLVFSRVLLASIKSLLRSATVFARHYPVLRTMQTLLTSEPIGNSQAKDDFAIQSRGEDVIGDVEVAHLSRGVPMAVISPTPVTRYNSFVFADGIAGLRTDHGRLLHASCHCISAALKSIPGGSIRELLHLEPEMRPEEANSILGLLELSDAMPDRADKPIDEAFWASLPAVTKAHMLLVSGERSAADLLLIEESVLCTSNATFLDLWWQRVRNQFVLIRYSGADTIGRFREANAMILASDRCLGIASTQWVADHTEEISQWLDTHALPVTENGELDDDDDDDD